jgi:hypothetical protein
MAILLYCIADRAASISKGITGVADSPVLRAEVGSLAAFISKSADSAVWLRAELRSAAMQFHKVQSEIFKSGSIIPVRFPTVFKDEEELRRRLQEQSEVYAQSLREFAGMAQMELRIQVLNSSDRENSGTEYLRNRRTGVRVAEEAGQQLREVLSTFAKDWRQAHVKDGLRICVLVRLEEVEGLRKKLRTAQLCDGIALRVSGPWPVSAFLPK